MDPVLALLVRILINNGRKNGNFDVGLPLTSPKCRPLNKYVILNLNLSSQRHKKLNVNHRRKRLFLFEKSFIFSSVLFPVCVKQP